MAEQMAEQMVPDELWMFINPLLPPELPLSRVGHYTSNPSAKKSYVCGISFVRRLHYRTGSQ
jgi:hypothetical protein